MEETSGSKRNLDVVANQEMIQNEDNEERGTNGNEAKNEKTEGGSEPEAKKQKREKPKKVRGLPEGMSRRAARKMKKEDRERKVKVCFNRIVDNKESLCKATALGEECSFGDGCKYNHDVETFLATKEPDIGPECYLFTMSGRCPFGLNCRFASAHTENKKPIVKKDFESKLLPEMNSLSKDLQVQLRKKKKKFVRSAPLVRQWREDKKKRVEENNPQMNSMGDKEDVPSIPSEEPTIIDKDVRIRPEEKKKIDWKDKLYLAPLTTVGNLPYRRICKRFGADITCGEMALASNLVQGQTSEWALLKRHPSEDIFGVQICGSYMDTMTQCAELLDETISVDFVDVNMGCPIDLVVKKGAGSALLENTRKIADITLNMNKILSVPLTIKVRTGKDEKNPTSHKFFPKLEDWGVSAVTIHGRSRQQRYMKDADWDYIGKCVSLTNLPVIGNGDLFNPLEYSENLEKSGVSSVMLARGALIKPWLFTELKERRLWDISSQERLEFAKDYCNFGLEHWGSDKEGVEKTRKFFLEWHSFLYRYIPVGLLEVSPPRMNHRPQTIQGRNELETLLGSPNVQDWIKISEMFLGPAPSNFVFAPKHRANSYDSNNG